MSKRIVFLDIDGVLVTSGTIQAFRAEFGLSLKDAAQQIDGQRLGYIVGLCQMQQAEVVIISHWRHDDMLPHHPGIDQLPLHKDWRTPLPARQLGAAGLFISDSRGTEIKHWLDAHPEVENYVIIDDGKDFLKEQRPRHIRPNFLEGLNLEHCQRAIMLFQRGPL